MAYFKPVPLLLLQFVSSQWPEIFQICAQSPLLLGSLVYHFLVILSAHFALLDRSSVKPLSLSVVPLSLTHVPSTDLLLAPIHNSAWCRMRNLVVNQSFSALEFTDVRYPLFPWRQGEDKVGIILAQFGCRNTRTTARGGPLIKVHLQDDSPRVLHFRF